MAFKISEQKLIRRTKRLVVRPYAANDYAAWKNHFTSALPSRNAWDVVKYSEPQLKKSDFKRILHQQKVDRAKDTNYYFGVFLKSGALIGLVSLMDVQRGVFHNAYLGYRLHNRYWGHGYMKEAVEAVIKLAFTDLKLHRLEAGIAPKNRRSLRLAKSLGLKKEGLSRRRLFLGGKWIDAFLFVALSEDFGYPWRGKNDYVPRRH